MPPIRHKSLLFLIYLYWIGHTAGAAGGTRGQAWASTTTRTDTISEAESAGLDHYARETLCSNQIAMCVVSCQNNILANTCDVETLAWSCSCQHGTRVFGAWQFPVPFQLCRKELEHCLDSCSSTQQAAIEQEVKQKNKQLSSPHSSSSENHQKRTYGCPSDLEPMDEIRLVRQRAKVQAASFSRLGKQRANMMDRKRKRSKRIESVGKKNKKAEQTSHTPKPRHVKSSIRVRAKAKGAQWTAQVNEVGKGKVVGLDGRIRVTAAQDEGERINTKATMDAAIDRDPTCVRHCRSVFACGTPTAPEYSGLDQFLENLGKSAKEPVHDSRSKDVSSGSNPGASRNVLAVRSAVLASLASLTGLSLFV